MKENMEERADLLTQWLRVLIYAHIVSVLNTVVSLISPVPAGLTAWVSRGITAAVLLSLLMLSPVSARYRKAGICRGVMLVCTLLTSFVVASSLLTLAASIFSLISVYQEYHGHGELIAQKEPGLAGKWSSLFGWGLAAGVLVSFGSVVAVLIAALLELEAMRITGIIIAVLSVPQLVIDLVYIRYLRKTISLLQDEL